MNCFNCGSEMSLQQAVCHNCGAPVAEAHLRKSWVKQNAAWLISVAVLFVLAVAAVFGFGAYRYLSRIQRLSARRAEMQYRTGQVQHGPPARSDEFHAHGKLYFVPVGKQVISADSLADYYRQKFAIEITVLPPVQLSSSAWLPQRRQYIAEEVIAAMTTAYPDIARMRDSVMIALTDADLYPQSLGWEFTYSFHFRRTAVVSTRRMDPAFWGDPPNAQYRLASTRQMLTKYVAMLYFHVPESFDTSSVMYSPLSPNGGPDVIYESDLHSDESALGQRGLPYPCLFFTYSYETHRIAPDVPLLSECKYGNPPHTTQEELFSTNLAWGKVTQNSMDLELDSTPAIQFRRFYDSGQHNLMTFGAGSNHTYNTYMYSDGFTLQTVSYLTQDDGDELVFNRMDKGRGFNPASVYESHDDGIYGARISWDADHYKLQYRDGAISTLLPCPSTTQRCYWNSYKDAKGHTLQFDRDAFRALRQLTASDGQGIKFELDDKRRTTAATATNGKRVTYEYDAAGCLAKVHRADGQVTLYQYDAGHRMTSVSVVAQPGASPQLVLATRYDSDGRVVEIRLDGVGAWKIEYLANHGDHAASWQLTDPQGRVSNIDIARTEDVYIARSSPVRFPRIATKAVITIPKK
ncbi:MAG TPA: DUF6531 domain-containing protein [Candidatus Angelobacter sp.]|nr:DUF6531 domain-containing protein [Candidatus Angelobacter sp.]